MVMSRNPVLWCLAAGSLVLLIAGIALGESVGVLVRHLLIPYSVDITRGVGRDGALWFRSLSLGLQALVAAAAFARSRATASDTRFSWSTAGVALTALYFILIVLGYLAPRFH